MCVIQTEVQWSRVPYTWRLYVYIVVVGVSSHVYKILPSLFDVNIRKSTLAAPGTSVFRGRVQPRLSSETTWIGASFCTIII